MNLKKLDETIVEAVPIALGLFFNSLPQLVSVVGVLAMPYLVVIKVLNFFQKGSYGWLDLLNVLLVVISLIYIERGLLRYISVIQESK